MFDSFQRRVLVIFLCLLAASASAEETPRGSQRLAVRHLSLDAAAAKLQTALDARGTTCSVFVDMKQRTLLVTGTAQACGSAAKLLAELDRPAAKNAAPREIARVAYQQDAEQPRNEPQTLRNISASDLMRSLSTALPQIRFEAGEGERLTARLPGEAKATLTVDPRTNAAYFEGPENTIAAWRKIVAALDAPRAADDAPPAVVALERADPAKVKQAVELLRAAKQAGGADDRPALRFIAKQQPPEAAAPAEDDGGEGPIGPVTIEILEGLDVIVVRGKKRDVERVQKIIEDIERQSQTTTPEIEILPLKHIDGKAAADLILQIYDQVFGARQSRVSMTPLFKPNALLLIGRKENVGAVKELIAKLDQPVPPQSQFRVFPLQHIAAADAERLVRSFFSGSTGAAGGAAPGGGAAGGTGGIERPGLGVRLIVAADARSNVLLVSAGARDLAELAEFIKRIDVETSETTNEMKIIRLKNAIAEELAPVLQEAITGQRTGGGGAAGNQTGGAAGANASRRSANLQLLQIDAQGRKLLESGVLSDLKITADPRANAIIVTGPAKGMELIEAIVRNLDQLPAAEAQIKVFTLTNGDAQTLSTSLQQLFGQSTGGQNQNNNLFGLPLAPASAGGESTLVPLRFAVDQRTNSVIATGSATDLEVVERILVRLDEGDVRRRKTVVYRLRNAPAVDVSTAINQFLQNQRQVNQLAPTLVSQNEQLEREVVVVPERVSNSLLVSATPLYFEEIQKIVEDLDKRPPMVVIQVLIAEVQLTNTDQFGVELGLQDSLLFDRGIGTVGFPFNNQALGNNSTAQALATRNNVGAQGLSSFSLGRTDTALGYGGMVLSASSDSVSLLVRALQASQRLQVISRPQVQTLDNQPAFVQVGARVPRISSSNQTTNGGIQNVTTLENVGILLQVTPRTSPDGLIVMQIGAEKSELSSEAQGIPIFINDNGQVVRSPQIFITTAQTTVSARSGQTVILGGLISKSRDQVSRRVPYLSDVPVLGRLFRFDSQTEVKKELLIIMTPQIVRNDEDVDWVNSRETERMNWCLSDVADVHGELPWARGTGPWNEKKTPVIFPDLDPTGTGVPGTTVPGTESPAVIPQETSLTPEVPSVVIDPQARLATPEPLELPQRRAANYSPNPSILKPATPEPITRLSAPANRR